MSAWESAAGSGYAPETSSVLTACRVLFGADVVLSDDFLAYLQPEGAKSAYRKRARESHPDAHPWVDGEQLQRLKHEFATVSDAYRELSTFLKFRPQAGTTVGNAARYRTREPRVQPAANASSRSDTPLYYTGALPSVELKIGRYLYFAGVASFQAVVAALSWQRMQRPSIGLLARSSGWLDEADVHHILQSGQVQGRFGERAVQLGLLRPWQQQELLKQQQSCQERLGQYFVRYQGISDYRMNQLNNERLRHNASACGC